MASRRNTPKHTTAYTGRDPEPVQGPRKLSFIEAYLAVHIEQEIKKAHAKGDTALATKYEEMLCQYVKPSVP